MKKLIFLLTFTLTITMFSHNGNTAPVTDGLVSYWTLDQQDIIDGTARDVWGKNDGTIVGDPKLVAGRVNGALEFDGFGDYVNLTTLGNFGSQLGTSTFEAWIKTSVKKVRWTTLFKVRDTDCGTDWGIDLNARTERPNLALGRPVKPIDTVNFAKDFILLYLAQKVGQNGCRSSITESSFSISDGEWHHLVYVNGTPYIDTDGRKLPGRALFIDGERIRKHSIMEFDDFMPFTEPVYLGAGNNHGKAEAFFNGIIDEVRIYNRPLTQDEVNQNFEIGLSVEATEKLPIVWATLKTTK